MGIKTAESVVELSLFETAYGTQVFGRILGVCVCVICPQLSVFSHSMYSPSGVVGAQDSSIYTKPGNSAGNRYPKTPSVLSSYFTEFLHMIENEVIPRRVSETRKCHMTRLANRVNVPVRFLAKIVLRKLLCAKEQSACPAEDLVVLLRTL